MKSFYFAALIATLIVPGLARSEEITLRGSDAASLAVIQAFAGAKNLGNRVKVSGYENASSLAQAQCGFTIQHPEDRDQPAKKSPGNQLSCSLQNKDGSKGSLNLDLSDAPISAWGSRNENSVQFDGDLAKNIYLTMEATRKTQPDNGIFGIIDWICAPDGSYCTQSTYISQNADENSPAFLICHRDLDHQSDGSDVIGNYACVILDSYGS